MDTIYRQAAIDALIEKEYALEKAENQYYLGIISERTKNEIVKFITNLPPVELKNDYKKALNCILTAYLNPEARHNILEKFVFETFSVGEEIKKEE